MSIRIMTRVWDARGLPSSGVRLVLLKLADCANDAGERAFPSVQTIADDCELDRSTVQRALRWLAAQGYIKQTERATHHRPAAWAICLDSNGCRYERVTLVEGPQNAASDQATEGPRLGAPGAASTAVRGRIHASADTVLGTTSEPSVPVQATGAALAPVAVAAELEKPHPVKALLTEHDRLFRQYVGQAPHYTGKDAKLAAQLIAQHGYDAVVAMLPALFTSLDPFVRQSGRDMAILSSCWNKLLVQAAPAVQMSENTTKTLTAGARWLAKQQKEAP